MIVFAALSFMTGTAMFFNYMKVNKIAFKRFYRTSWKVFTSKIYLCRDHFLKCTPPAITNIFYCIILSDTIFYSKARKVFRNKVSLHNTIYIMCFVHSNNSKVFCLIIHETDCKKQRTKLNLIFTQRTHVYTNLHTFRHKQLYNNCRVLAQW